MTTSEPQLAARGADPIDAMIAATNSEERKAFIQTFAPDAVVDDFGRLFKGRVEIQEWSDRENIGTHNRIAVTNRVSRDGQEVLTVRVTGDGYNGNGTFEMRLQERLITHLVIRE